MLTPEKVVFKGEAEMVVVKALDGEVGILAGHLPMVASLEPYMIRIKTGGEEKVLANGEGFMQVKPTEVLILCQTMEWPEEIELSRVQRAIEEHQAKLKNATSDAEYRLSRATLARAFARMAVKNYR